MLAIDIVLADNNYLRENNCREASFLAHVCFTGGTHVIERYRKVKSLGFKQLFLLYISAGYLLITGHA